MLVKHYDDIFPENQYTYDFLREDLEPGDKVLDVACGTGSYTIHLIKDGISACGLDLEETMIELADEKAIKDGITPDFVVASMLNLDLVSDGDLRRIYIIGNSLVHLKSLEEVRSFLKSAYDLLNDNGDLVIQIINYERILTQDINHLPTIEVSDKGIVFERNYNYDVSSNSIEFASRLSIEGELKESSIYLLPLDKDVLIAELEKTGFSDIEVYSNFKKEPFTEDAITLVIKTTKNT